MHFAHADIESLFDGVFIFISSMLRVRPFSRGPWSCNTRSISLYCFLLDMNCSLGLGNALVPGINSIRLVSFAE